MGVSWYNREAKLYVPKGQNIDIISVLKTQVELPFGKIRYVGDKSGVSNSNLNLYLSNRSQQLHSDEGEIICIGHGGYDIMSTEFICVKATSIYHTFLKYKDKSQSATLLYVDENTISIVSSGTIHHMKLLAHAMLRADNYESATALYIITKQNVIQVGCKKKHYKTTQRYSDPDNLVLECCTFGIYGWQVI